jgi:hypothetical protein
VQEFPQCESCNAAFGWELDGSSGRFVTNAAPSNDVRYEGIYSRWLQQSESLLYRT